MKSYDFPLKYHVRYSKNFPDSNKVFDVFSHDNGDVLWAPSWGVMI